MGKKGKKGKAKSVDVSTGLKKEEKVVSSEVEKQGQPEKELGEKNLDDFLNDWDNNESDDEEESDDVMEDEGEAEVNDGDDDEEEDDDGEEESDESDEDEAEEEEKKDEQVKKKTKTGAKDQKNYISKLKEKDPEFFEFLKENDQELLNFDESSDDDEDDGKEEKREKGKHKLPEKLEVASDESDFEEDDEEAGKEDKPEGSSKKLNQSQIEAWSTSLTSTPTASLVTEVMAAFRGAVATVSAGGEEVGEAKWKVEGGAMFNSVVRLAVVGLVPALRKVLKLESEKGEGGTKFEKPEKSKQWRRLERPLRGYMLDLVALLGRIGESSVLGVLLKHTHSMLPFYQAFAKGGKQLMNRLVSIWSRAEETPRILAFMCIVKLVRGRELLEPAVKAMYLAYVKNTKFTSPSTLQSISFMRRSLVELLGLDHSLAYYHAFVYIRQLAIHLRNAITCSEKKDSLLAVYNWQFVHSLELWGALVGHPGSREAMAPLVYPLVQVVLGACRLVPTPKYYPLRFHCAKILREISASTATFIPILPIYLEVLNNFNFSKKSRKASMKPLDFSCILKLAKSQLEESGMKEATMEEVYSGLLSYLADNSNRIGFPELVTPMQFQLKDFLKKCKTASYSKKVKQVLDKTVANAKFIETRRKNVSFGVGDKTAIQAWEAQVARDGTPLLAFYKSWRKVADVQQAKKVADQEKISDFSHIPALKKNHKKLRMKREMEEEVEGGFLSGSDDDFDDEENFKLKEERGKKRKNSEGSEEDDNESEYESPKKAKKSVKQDEEEDDQVDDGGEDDEVEDLKLEDLDSDLEMEDDFGAGSDDGEDDSDQEEDSDDESDEN